MAPANQPDVIHSLRARYSCRSKPRNYSISEESASWDEFVKEIASYKKTLMQRCGSCIERFLSPNVSKEYKI